MHFRLTITLAAITVLAHGATIIDTGAGFSSTLITTANDLNSSDTPAYIVDLNDPSLSYSASQNAAQTASAAASVSLAAGSGNIGLHGVASANAPSQSQAHGTFDIYAYDLFTVAGSGYQTFQYTLTLDGSVNLTGDPPTDTGYSEASGELRLFGNESYQDYGNVAPNPSCSSTVSYVLNYTQDFGCGVISTVSMSTYGPGLTGSSATGTISILGGTSVELGLYLIGAAQAYNFSFVDPGSPDIQAQFNAANTGFFTLTPVTPGASFTTASGLTYASSPDTSATPEPASIATFLIGIAGLLVAHRFKPGTATRA